MSLILDALKKMEQDKARRRIQSMELGPAILQERNRHAASRLRTPAVVACAVVITAIATYLLMNLIPKNLAEQAVPAPVAQQLPAPPAIEPARPLPPPPPEAILASPSPLPAPAPAQAAALPPSASASSATAPVLVVNGIAWQEERHGRRAVVNGVLVAEGAMVAGARVTEIHAGKVVFSSGGQILEIPNSSPFH